MKTLSLASLVILLCTTQLYAKTLVVSDVDDTIKVTNVLNKADAVYNGLFSTRAFTGMSEVYNGLNNADTTIFYVSGSPEMIRSKVSKMLIVNKFPQKDNLILKSGRQDTFAYKFSNISKLINEQNPDEVILLGDDTEKDPEIFDAISKTFPSQIKSIHIRLIQNRKLPVNEKMNGFFSAAEVAGREFLNGKISEETVNQAAKVIATEKDERKLFIEDRYCPSEGRLEIEELKHKTTIQSIVTSLESVQEKTISVCMEK